MGSPADQRTGGVIDLELDDSGPTLLWPQSAAGEAWVHQLASALTAPCWIGRALVIEPDDMTATVARARRDGLTVRLRQA